MAEPVERGSLLSTVPRLVLGYLVIALMAALIFPLMLLALPWRELRIRLGNLYGKVVGRIVPRIAGARVRVEGLERIRESAPAIYVSNHVSFLDAILGMWLCPWGGCGVAKREIASMPVFGQLYRVSGHLLIDRDRSRESIERLNRTAAWVRERGLSIYLWPEGTRSPDGRLQPLKKGFVHLAVATGYPVVPIVIQGAEKVWPKGSWRLRSGEVTVRVLPPIDTSGWSSERAAEHAAEVHRIMTEALGQAPGEE